MLKAIPVFGSFLIISSPLHSSSDSYKQVMCKESPGRTPWKEVWNIILVGATCQSHCTCVVNRLCTRNAWNATMVQPVSQTAVML